MYLYAFRLHAFRPSHRTDARFDFPVAMFCFCFFPNHFKHLRSSLGCLTISLNDQLHITPKSEAINQSASAFGAVSYLKQAPHPPVWNVGALFQPNGKKKVTVFQEICHSCLDRLSQ